MAIETLASGSSAANVESFTFLVDYDTVAQTIGLTMTGTGHAQLDVLHVANKQDLGSLNGDQFGATAGTIKQAQTVIDGVSQGDAGQSTGAVTYDGTRHIALGPGAAGIDSTGHVLPTGGITATVVGQFNVPKGQTPDLAVTFDWSPNSFGLLRQVLRLLKRKPRRKVAPVSLAESVKRCLHHKHRR